tara:strand:+ start:10207 stop:10884 length:678 start_codon:yes stop_codon:yes gene_type:complete
METSKELTTEELFHRFSAKLPSSAYKELRLGGRTMTVIDAYHILQRLTQVLGMQGWGWGIHVDEYEERDGFIAAMGHLWYMHKGQKCIIQAVGDARIFKGNFAEGRKKAQTNLMSKASSFMGVGLSVYQGRGIDDPYIDAEHGKEDRPPPQLEAGAWMEAETIKGRPLIDLGVKEREEMIEWKNRVVTHSLNDERFRLWHYITQMQNEQDASKELKVSKQSTKAA